eukprot:TRINITY_DN3279_c0_g2_i2.p1 TRINITY_DN3279_c0_g2~~TRINITY_DN3279_c0_g2_i2.p1  ORF type:complete len:1296 (+),score=155.79 TRINITY_DN3279_c0_g2_i2:409-3888(+)
MHEMDLMATLVRWAQPGMLDPGCNDGKSLLRSLGHYASVHASVDAAVEKSRGWICPGGTYSIDTLEKCQTAYDAHMAWTGEWSPREVYASRGHMDDFAWRGIPYGCSFEVNYRIPHFNGNLMSSHRPEVVGEFESFCEVPQLSGVIMEMELLPPEDISQNWFLSLREVMGDRTDDTSFLAVMKSYGREKNLPFFSSANVDENQSQASVEGDGASQTKISKDTLSMRVARDISLRTHDEAYSPIIMSMMIRNESFSMDSFPKDVDTTDYVRHFDRDVNGKTYKVIEIHRHLKENLQYRLNKNAWENLRHRFSMHATWKNKSGAVDQVVTEIDAWFLNLSKDTNTQFRIKKTLYLERRNGLPLSEALVHAFANNFKKEMRTFDTQDGRKVMVLQRFNASCFTQLEYSARSLQLIFPALYDPRDIHSAWYCSEANCPHGRLSRLKFRKRRLEPNEEVTDVVLQKSWEALADNKTFYSSTNELEAAFTLASNLLVIHVTTRIQDPSRECSQRTCSCAKQIFDGLYKEGERQEVFGGLSDGADGERSEVDSSGVPAPQGPSNDVDIKDEDTAAQQKQQEKMAAIENAEKEICTSDKYVCGSGFSCSTINDWKDQQAEMQGNALATALFFAGLGVNQLGVLLGVHTLVVLPFPKIFWGILVASGYADTFREEKSICLPTTCTWDSSKRRCSIQSARGQEVMEQDEHAHLTYFTKCVPVRQQADTIELLRKGNSALDVAFGDSHFTARRPIQCALRMCGVQKQANGFRDDTDEEKRHIHPLELWHCGADESFKALRVGDEVKFLGLDTADALGVMVGSILEIGEDKSRFVVEVNSYSVISVRRENLRRTRQKAPSAEEECEEEAADLEQLPPGEGVEALNVGESVKFWNLNSKAGWLLNGRVGFINACSYDGTRCLVTLTPGKFADVRGQNLRFWREQDQWKKEVDVGDSVELFGLQSEEAAAMLNGQVGSLVRIPDFNFRSPFEQDRGNYINALTDRFANWHGLETRFEVALRPGTALNVRVERLRRWSEDGGPALKPTEATCLADTGVRCGPFSPRSPSTNASCSGAPWFQCVCPEGWCAEQGACKRALDFWKPGTKVTLSGNQTKDRRFYDSRLEVDKVFEGVVGTIVGYSKETQHWSVEINSDTFLKVRPMNLRRWYTYVSI